MVAVEAGRGLVYVANPNSLERVAAGDSWPVGVPAEDVFQFDEAAFTALVTLWVPAMRLGREEWRAFKLALYRPDADELAA